MAKRYQAPPELRELEKLIDAFARDYGIHHMTVFRDFLRFVINGWTIPGYPGYDDWKYTEKQNKRFYEMNQAWVLIMAEQIKRHNFYDAFARLHPSYLSKKEAQVKGQFMSPASLAALLTQLVVNREGKEGFEKVYDPVGGSGGLMLAAHAEWPRKYYVTWDMDYTMCLQAVCNFIIHGVVGTVACINTLTMQNFQGAWLVNEFLYRTGIPTVRPMTEEEYNQHVNSDKQWGYFLNQEEYDSLERSMKILSIIKGMNQ